MEFICIMTTWDQAMLVQLAAHIFVLVARKLYLIDYCFDNNFKAVHQKMVKYVNKLLKQLVNF